MTHPKARTKPRRRERSDPADRILLTFKGRMMLATLDALRRIRARPERAKDTRAVPEAPASLPEPGESPGARSNQDHEHGRATPCAPNRAACPTPANCIKSGCHGACTPAHPAGKSGAAAIAQNPHGASSQPSGTEAKLPDRAAPHKEPTP